MATSQKIPFDMSAKLPFPEEELWTVQKKIRLENEGYWMLLRPLPNKATGLMYYDILAGKQGEDPHLHYGHDLVGRRIFEEPRGRVHWLRREVESLMRGKISDDTEVLKDTDGAMTYKFRVTVDLKTKESWVSIFEINPAHSPAAHLGSS